MSKRYNIEFNIAFYDPEQKKVHEVSTSPGFNTEYIVEQKRRYQGSEHVDDEGIPKDGNTGQPSRRKKPCKTKLMAEYIRDADTCRKSKK